jgi:hypothetical protein
MPTETTDPLTAIGKDLDDLAYAYGARPRDLGETDQSYRQALINRIGSPQTATGGFLDAIFTNVSLSRMLIRMPWWQTVKEFVLRRRRFHSITGNPIPWGYRDELDSELRARTQARIDAET